MILKTFRLLLLSIFCLTTAIAAHADATAKLVGDKIVLENQKLRVTISPKDGGRIDEYIYKPWDNTNLAFPTESNGGLTMDMFWQHSWPGELLKNPYEFEITSAGPQEAAVKVWRVSTGEAGGKMVEDVAGIRVERTIRLRTGERALNVAVSLTNTTQTGRLAGYWMQNNFFLPGGKEANTWYRPSIYGVDTIATQKPSQYYWYFLEAPTAGWIGVANKDLNGGLMLLMDYNDLWKFYTNMDAITTELFYDRVAIPPGKSWKTEVDIIPTPGLSSYAFGSKPLVAALEIQPAATGVRIVHKMTSGTTGLKNATVKTWAEDARGAWKTKVVEQKIAQVTAETVSLTTELPDAKEAPFAVRVEVEGTTPQGEKVKFQYGDYSSGTAGKNINLENLLPQYSFPRPPKDKVFLKPDVIVKKKNDHPRVLFVRGLWHEYSGVDEALKQIPNVEVVDSWYEQSDTGTSLLNFPPDYDTLLSYDVIVLANVDGGSLGLVGQEMIADFVGAGGGVLLVGGDRTYGQAAFDNERFMKIMPVKIGGPFDWHKMDAPASLTSKDITFNPQTVARYRHFLQPTDGATVAVRAGEVPALVTQQFGPGRVAASLLLPFGETAPGQVDYWKSPQWQSELSRVLKSLAAAP